MIAFTQNPEQLEWASRILNVKYDPNLCSWLSELSEDGETRAVVVFTRFTPYNCEMSVASDGSSKWFSSRAARAWFGYPFNQLRVNRVTAVAEQFNERSISMLRKLGFVEEGTLKQWFGQQDGIVFRMLKDECTWI